MNNRIITVLTAIIITSAAFGQAPQKMSYQAVIRNSSNVFVTGVPVGMRISIIQGTSTGPVIYAETQTPVTNANGLATIEIGAGTIVTGSFSAINWSQGPYFIKTETDPSGSTNYSISSVKELMSVPYALFATNAESSTGSWSTTGNAGLTDSLNFIGTTDNIPLNIRVNNQRSGKIDPVLLNTFLGYQAGNSNTTGYNNTGKGSWALQFNTSGYNNSAVGVWALQYNTTGYNNTAHGMLALQGNTSGYNNTANGVQSLLTNTDGYSNTATGFAALSTNTSGSNNTANGQGALLTNTTGNNNLANGMDALYKNTIGNSNTANGKAALFSNDHGNNNCATGDGSLFSNVSGSYNTATGESSLFYNTEGFQNTATGVNALFSNTTGYQNTANGYKSLYSNSTGYQNIALGFQALYNNTTGISNTALGFNALNSGSGFSNSTALGYNAQVTASNMVQLGDTSITDVKTLGTFTARGFTTAYVPKNVNYQLTAKDDIVGVTGVATITLPSAAGIIGRQYTIKNIAVTMINVTVNTTSGQTIDGTATKTLTQYKYMTVVSNGSNWFIIANN